MELKTLIEKYTSLVNETKDYLIHLNDVSNRVGKPLYNQKREAKNLIHTTELFIEDLHKLDGGVE